MNANANADGKGWLVKLDVAGIIRTCFPEMHSDGCLDEYDNISPVIMLVVG
jgi:hypothetical protein